MVDAEVKDQAPAPGLIPEKMADLHIAAPLACACRDSVLCAQDMSGRANNGPITLTIQSCALVATEWAVQVLVWSP
jgi:hypothetical protein